MLNSNLNRYFDELYSILSNGIETEIGEFGFFEGRVGNKAIFEPTLQRFIFISKFFDVVSPITNNILQETLKKYDSENAGRIALLENDFAKLIRKNQEIIIEIDKDYIHQFVKVSLYIDTKRKNIETFYSLIKEGYTIDLKNKLQLLDKQIHSYELLLFHSINLIGALKKKDLITFYEIYESFDKINIYNSNFENEVSIKLTHISDKLDDLMLAIEKMEVNIINEISYLTYVTQDSFAELSENVTSQLKEVESSINTTNLLTAIQSYQLYKINKTVKL